MEISQSCSNVLGLLKYTFIYFVFIHLFISQFSFMTQHKATEMYWFSSSYLKHLYRQHRHSCTCCQWFPGLYCARAASQNNCMLAHHGPSVKQRRFPTGNAINSFWVWKIPLVTGVTTRADRSVCHICSQRGCCACQYCYVSAIQSALGKEEAMQMFNRSTSCNTRAVYHFRQLEQEGSCLLSTFFLIKPSLLLGKHQCAKRSKTKKLQ